MLREQVVKQRESLSTQYREDADKNIRFIEDFDSALPILTEKYRDYIKGPGHDIVRLLAGEGLLVSEGDKWREQRQMLNAYFLHDKAGFFCSAIQSANDQLDEWLSETVTEVTSVNPLSLASRYTLDVFLKAVFSTSLPGIYDDPSHCMAWLLERQERDVLYAKRFRHLRATLSPIVEERLSGSAAHDDLCQVLVTAYRDRPSGLPEIMDQLMNLLIGAIETSAYALVAALYHLAVEPEAARHLLVDSDLNTVSFKRLGSPDGLDGFIDEVLRLYPPVWLLSRSKVSGCPHHSETEPGDVCISVFDIHRDPADWASADVFDPARFRKASTQHTYIPFGLGPRQCIGKNLALAEMRGFLSVVLSGYRLAVPDNVQTPRIIAKVNLLLDVEELMISPL